jgi:hypothetical protein
VEQATSTASSYFEPGYWASLQFAAAPENFDMFEYLYVRPDTWCGIDASQLAGEHIDIPNKFGIGSEPDLAVMLRYRV